MRYLVLLSVLAFSSISALGCHHTGQGIKADVKHDLHKTGEGVEHVGEKIDGKK